MKNSTPRPPIFYGTDEYRTIIVVLLVIVICIGFFGNLMVYSAISYRQKQKRTSTNYLLMNIAVADLLVGGAASHSVNRLYMVIPPAR